MKHILLLISVFCCSQLLTAQNDVVIDNGTFESCGGLFIDSGGQGGPGYGNDEYFVCTICPDVEGDVITVDFVTFALDQSGNENTWDYLAIYDGDNTGEASLGFYTGNQLEGLFVTGTSQNTSGCLTFVFDSNSAKGDQDGSVATRSCKLTRLVEAHPLSSVKYSSTTYSPGSLNV